MTVSAWILAFILGYIGITNDSKVQAMGPGCCAQVELLKDANYTLRDSIKGAIIALNKNDYIISLVFD